MRLARHPRRIAALLAAVACTGALCALVVPAASARVVRPTLVWVRCIRTALPCHAGSPVVVVRTGELEVGAHGLLARTRILFPARDGSRHWTRSVIGKLVRSTRMRVNVPSDAIRGTLRLVSPGSAKSNGITITVRRPPAPVKPPVTPPPVVAGSSVLNGTGMWIWYLSASQGGDPVAIGRQAAAYGIKTAFVKSGDGGNTWAQFSPATVAALKAQGLHVCAWQYVYGNSPLAEAQVGIQSARNGADCLVIDAESEYEGRYAQAQQYVQALRQGLGPAYPVGLAGFPYVDYHPAFPYSVFLGPGGAQYNLPQMYWQDIGVSPDAVYAHTWPLNRVYGAPTYPLGQIYNNPPASAVLRFRQDAAAYGATGVSWWDWQEATSGGFNAVGSPIQPLAPPSPAPGYPTLSNGSQGDLVVWAQEHLVAAGANIPVDGSFGNATASAVKAFQSAKAIQPTGIIGAVTWPALLALAVTTHNWNATYRPAAAAARAASAGASGAGAAAATRSGRNGPQSAFLPAVRDEVGRVG